MILIPTIVFAYGACYHFEFCGHKFSNNTKVIALINRPFCSCADVQQR